MFVSTESQRESTSERLLARYHSYSGRRTVENARTRTAIFGSLHRTLGRWLPSDRSTRILDIACGEGALLCFLKALGYQKLDGFDISPENVGICHRLGLSFVRQADALEMLHAPIAERYGTIFALDILEHLPKQGAAALLDNVRQSLAPGGAVIIQTPNMGSLHGLHIRYSDLSHEFSLTERSAATLLMTAGFDARRIEVRPAWGATTLLGRLREQYLRLVHQAVFLGAGEGRPRIPTKNLLIRGSVE